MLDVQYDQWYILKNERGSLYFKPHLKLPTNEIEGKFFQDNGNFYQQTSIAYLTSNGLFDKEKRPIIKGNVTTEKNKIIVTSNEQTLEFHLLEQEKDLPHYFPFYDSFLTREQINQVTVQYGSAKGFYSSKVYNHISSENYGDIILDILDELRKNLATPQTLNLEMDIYYPRIPLKYKLPVLFLFHGGAFVIGDKQDRLQKELANYFAARGYVVVSVNYRLGYVAIPGLYSNLERAMYKAVQDARAAMRWMAKHANKYGIDPHMFFLAGNSAGGFISLMTAFMKEDEVFPSTRGSTFLLQPDLGCLDCSGNDFKVNYSIRGVVNLWGGLLDLNLIDRDEKIPLLLIHGENDQIVPADYNYPFQNVSPEAGSLLSASIYGSKRIFEHARKLNLPVSLYLIPNEGHEPQLDSTFQLTHWLDSIQTKMREFLYGIIVKSLSPLKIWTWDELPHRFRIKTNHSIKLYRVYPENILFTEEDSTYRLIVLDSQPD
ncbi:MAG: alpha/beta hydrolase fold domain-containing protein, partial [Bacteroidales bacterium]|nr:alpha/beta hydrolase fold domain-containing protein [Bacteroidales bacterium]